MSREVLPFLHSHARVSTFHARDGLDIAYATLPGTSPSKGTIVISPGRSETILGFSEWIYDLHQEGYSVAAIDHRGQGWSDRLIAGSTIGHVGHFRDYVGDFSQFVEKVLPRELPGPYFVLADSMGAAIAATYMIKKPTAFRSAVLAVPMFDINMRNVPSWIIRSALWTQIAIGLGDHYAPSRGPYNFHQMFEGNIFTGSQARFDFDALMTRQDPITATGGPSARWVYEAMGAATQLKKQASQLKTPILAITAGDDRVVNNRGIERICAAARDCELQTYPGAKHWILMESDSIKEPLKARALKFFSRTR